MCVYVVCNYLLTSVVCRLLFHIVQQKGPVQGLMSSMKTNLLENKFLENNVGKLHSDGSTLKKKVAGAAGTVPHATQVRLGLFMLSLLPSTIVFIVV